MVDITSSGALGRRIGELYRLGGAPRVREALGGFALMAVFSRARLGPGIAPFAAAYFSAELMRGTSLPALLVGCAVGSFLLGFEPASLFPPAACAVALTLWLLWDFLARRIARLRREESAVPVALAGLSVLLPALAAAGDEPANWLVALLAAVGAALLAAAFSAGERAQVLGGKVALAALSCAGVLCAGGLRLDPVPFAAFFAVAAGAAGRGALFGTALGAACAIAGSGPGGFALVCAVGGAADAANHMKKRGALWRSLGAVLAWALMRVWLGAAASWWVLATCAAQAAVPERFFERIAETYQPKARRDDRITLALRRRSEVGLRAMSDAFLAMSEACGGGDPAFGEQLLLSRMRAALCGGCPDYAACWPGANSRAVKLFCQLMTAAIECGGSPFDGAEIPPDILRLCRRGMTVPTRLGGLLNEFAVQRHKRIRLMEAHRLIGAQFRQAAELLNFLAADQARPVSARDGAAARARDALVAAGFPVREVTALKAGRLELTAELRRPWAADEPPRAALELSRALNRPFGPDSSVDAVAIFVPRSALDAQTGVSTLPAEPDLPSGDSHLIRRLSADRLLVALSDGMGSGEAAAEESDKVLRLIHALVAAEVPRELAVTTVNGVMLARGGDELFATVDMLLIDLAAARADFTKLSACRSYVVRAGELIAVEGGRLPLGILDDVQPGLTTINLRVGDVIVMMTDGVAETLPEEVMEDLVLNAAFAAPNALAETIINAAAARAPRRRDDMTAVCVRIERA